MIQGKALSTTWDLADGFALTITSYWGSLTYRGDKIATCVHEDCLLLGLRRLVFGEHMYYMPVLDHHSPPLPYVLECIQASEKVTSFAVACNGGHGRSAGIALCILAYRAVMNQSVLNQLANSTNIAPPQLSETPTAADIKEIGQMANRFLSDRRKVRKNMYEQDAFKHFADWLARGGEFPTKVTGESGRASGLASGRASGRASGQASGRASGRASWVGYHSQSDYYPVAKEKHE